MARPRSARRSTPRRTLVVHAHPGDDSLSAALLDATLSGLDRAGHEVVLQRLHPDGFRAAMSAEERREYHDEYPPTDPIARRYADEIGGVESMVFVYPTWWFGPPALLKGWFDRVLVHGVAFSLDDDGGLRSHLRHVRRVAGVTTYGSPRWVVRLSGDGGRRSINRTLRMMCHPRCRTTWHGLYAVDEAEPATTGAYVREVEEAFATW
ncbi:MAG: NAD(P)H-dependent oxidoreductase [Actinomycetota bacterium]